MKTETKPKGLKGDGEPETDVGWQDLAVGVTVGVILLGLVAFGLYRWLAH